MPIYPVDMSYDLPAAVVVAQQGGDRVLEKTLTLGVCELVEANIPKLNPDSSSQLEVYPASSVKDYLNKHNLYGGEYPDAREVVTLSPDHGKIRFNGDAEDQIMDGVVYVPDGGYVGEDRFGYSVSVGGRQIFINYYIHVVDYPKYVTAYNYTDFDPYKRECGDHGNGGEAWKISSMPNLHNLS